MDRIDELKDKYFNSKSTVTDISDARKEIESNIDNDDFELERLVAAGYYANEKERIKEELNQIKNSSETKTIPINGAKKSNIRKYISIAASLILLAVFTIVMNNYLGDNVDSNKAYLAQLDDFNASELGKLSVRSGGQTTTDLISNLKEGLAASNKNDHSSALTTFQNLQSNDAGNELVNLQVAVQQFLLGQYPDVINQEKNLLSIKDRSYREEAEFLVVQSHINLGSNRNAYENLLSQIKGDASHKYYSLAKEINPK